MATTTNYGWTTPDDTALVKDGASAIRTLGSSVDTSLKTVSDGRGLVWLNTTSFSAVSSQSVSNFTSSSYNYYRVVANAIASGSNIEFRFRFRENTTDKATSYYGATTYYRYTAASSGFLYASNNSTYASLTAIGSGNPSPISFDFYKPENGKAYVVGQSYNNNDGDLIVFAYGNNSMTDATGLTIYPSSGTFTGQISVFAYKK